LNWTLPIVRPPDHATTSLGSALILFSSIRPKTQSYKSCKMKSVSAVIFVAACEACKAPVQTITLIRRRESRRLKVSHLVYCPCSWRPGFAHNILKHSRMPSKLIPSAFNRSSNLRERFFSLSKQANNRHRSSLPD
jgi:hypothetical protein